MPVVGLRGGRVSCNLVLVDCVGRQIELDHSNWVKHVAKRPEIAPYHAVLGHAVNWPDCIIRADRDGHWHYYRSGLTEDRYPGCYLRVVVADFGPAHKITTTNIAPVITTIGGEIWPRLRSP
jgi:hypothetical protein